MGQTKIEWCDFTFNPWIGCSKVSPGCANCYAETLMDKRYGKVKWGKGRARIRTSESNWKLPLKWNREASKFAEAALGYGTSVGMHPAKRQRVFCASLADWLDDEVPIEWLADLLKLIHDTPNLDWLLLTKRPENARTRTLSVMTYWATHGGGDAAAWLDGWRSGKNPPANVWVGTSVEDQARADERIPKLLKIPARVRFLSVEPLLGPIRFGAFSEDMMQGIHWAIFGGESGTGARPCKVEWIRDGVRQCKAAGVACFVKQLGALPEITPQGYDPISGRVQATMRMFGIKDKKGGDMSEWPEDLRFREFPKI